MRHNAHPFRRTPPRLSGPEFGLLAQKLALLLQSGVPVLDALGAISLQARAPSLGCALALVRQDMAGGQRLSSSLRSRFCKLPEHCLALVHAGEESGSLAQVLERLSADLEHEQSLRREIAHASMYPLFVSIASVLLGLAILAFIVPSFRELYSDFGVELPALTQASLSASDAIIAWWPLLFASAAAALASAWRLAASSRGAALLRMLALNLPLYGAFLRTCGLSRVTGALGTLIASGMPIPRALALAAGTAPHRKASEELEEWSRMTLQGSSLSSLAHNSAAFPREVSHMIALGESSGRLEEVLSTLSALYYREAHQKAATIQVLVEPLLIAFAGGIVATLLMALYLPIFELGGVANP